MKSEFPDDHLFVIDTLVVIILSTRMFTVVCGGFPLSIYLALSLAVEATVVPPLD